MFDSNMLYLDHGNGFIVHVSVKAHQIVHIRRMQWLSVKYPPKLNIRQRNCKLGIRWRKRKEKTHTTQTLSGAERGGGGCNTF